MKEFFARLTVEAPKFFKRMRAFGLWLTGLSGTFYATASAFPNMNIPAWITTGLTYTTLAGVIIAAVSSFTVNSSEELEKKIHK